VTTNDVASGYPKHTNGGGNKKSKTSSGVGVMLAGGMGAAALFGGAAPAVNW
jgi:hypothetical protein